MSRHIAWGLALVTMLAAVVLAARAAGPQVTSSTIAEPRGDPELVRCRAAGEGAVADPACRRAWDEARARFFGRTAQ